MKSAILRSDVEMLFKLISMNSLVPNKKIESAVLSQDFGLASWFSKYRIEEESSPCGRHVFVSVLLTHFLWEFSMFFEPIALLMVLFSSTSDVKSIVWSIYIVSARCQS